MSSDVLSSSVNHVQGARAIFGSRRPLLFRLLLPDRCISRIKNWHVTSLVCAFRTHQRLQFPPLNKQQNRSCTHGKQRFTLSAHLFCFICYARAHICCFAPLLLAAWRNRDRIFLENKYPGMMKCPGICFTKHDQTFTLTESRNGPCIPYITAKGKGGQPRHLDSSTCIRQILHTTACNVLRDDMQTPLQGLHLSP